MSEEPTFENLPQPWRDAVNVVIADLEDDNGHLINDAFRKYMAYLHDFVLTEPPDEAMILAFRDKYLGFSGGWSYAVGLPESQLAML